jgi:hypothetical protein
MLARLERAADDLLQRLKGEDLQRRPLGRSDALLAALCGIIATAVAAWAASRIGDVLYTEGSFGIWFQADNPRVVANLLDVTSDQYRANVHPIFPILLTPWVSLLPKLGASPLFWGKLVVFLCGGASAAAMFVALRLLGIARVGALVFAALFIASAAYLHWYSVIESAPFNGLSTTLAVLALAYGATRRKAWWIAMSVLTLGMTITNWTAGLAATIARWRVRDAILISATALALVAGLSVAQRLIWPTAGVFFNPYGLLRESAYAATAQPRWSPIENMEALVIYTMAAPPPVLERQEPFVVVTNQARGWTQVSAPRLVAVVGWTLLLALGAFAAVRERPLRPIALGLGLMVAAQCALAVVYGEITFLYATNILPMLIAAAALAWFLPRRNLVVLLAAVVVAASAASNVVQLDRAAIFAERALEAGGNPVWSRYPADGFVLPLPGRGQ